MGQAFPVEVVTTSFVIGVPCAHLKPLHGPRVHVLRLASVLVLVRCFTFGADVNGFAGEGDLEGPGGLPVGVGGGGRPFGNNGVGAVAGDEDDVIVFDRLSTSGAEVDGWECQCDGSVVFDDGARADGNVGHGVVQRLDEVAVDGPDEGSPRSRAVSY